MAVCSKEVGQLCSAVRPELVVFQTEIRVLLLPATELDGGVKKEKGVVGRALRGGRQPRALAHAERVHKASSLGILSITDPGNVDFVKPV